MTGLVIALGGVLFLGGLVAAYWSHVGRKPYELVERTETVDAGDVTPGELVAVSGEVVPLDDRASGFSSPVTHDDEAVLGAWRVEEWSERGSNWARWKTLAAGVRSGPFAVEDDTGSVRVEASDGAGRRGVLAIPWSPRVSDGLAFDDQVFEFFDLPVARAVGAGEETPEAVRRFVTSEPTVDEQTDSITNLVDVGNAHGDRRYYEKTIDECERAYVLGRAREGDDGAVITAPRSDEDGLLLVSDKDESRLAGGTLKHRIGLALGVVLVVAGVAVAAAGAWTI